MEKDLRRLSSDLSGEKADNENTGSYRSGKPLRRPKTMQCQVFPQPMETLG